MRRYETIYILRPSLGENEITTIIENTNQIIKDVDGSIISLQKWGMKKLAYLIKKESQGYYVFFDYTATPEAIAEMERKFRIDDAVLKYLTVKIADSISSEQIEAAAVEAEAKLAAAQEEESASDDSNDEEE